MKRIPIENKKRRQVSSGATVITSDEAITILRNKEREKSIPKSYKRKKQADVVPVMGVDDVPNENVFVVVVPPDDQISRYNQNLQPSSSGTQIMYL